MKAEFIPNYPLAQLKPADYNPRHLDEEKFVLLQESLRKFGVIKPVIINGENGILKTIYSKQVQHGTIHDIWQAVGTGSWFPEIDFDNKDNWDVRPFD